MDVEGVISMKNFIARFAMICLAILILGPVFSSAQTAKVKKAQAFGPRRGPMEQSLGNQGGGPGRWWNNQRMVDQLKLTDEQRKAMDQIFYDHRAKLIDLQANLQKAELAMQPLMSADKPDQKAMESQIDKVVAARSELERANSRFLLDIRMKLTTDQWTQLRNMRGNMMGPGGQGPQGPDGMRDRRNDRRMPPAPPAGPSAPAPPAGQGSGSGMVQ